MHIAVLCAVSVVLTLFTWVYTANHGMEQEENAPSMLSKKVLFASKGRLVYLLAMLIGLVGMSVALHLIYPRNSLIHNMKLVCVLGLLFAAAEIDFRKRIIPNMLVLVGVALRVVFWIAEMITDFDGFWRIFKDGLTACGLVVVFFVIGVLLIRDGIGLGDIKLMLVMCLYQGFAGVVSALFFSLAAAFAVTVVPLLLRKKTLRDTIVFAPSILIGTMVSVFMTGM